MEGSLDIAPHIARFEESEEGTRDARKLSERDRDYRDNKQLTAKEMETLRKRGQPPVVYNLIQRKVDYLSGLEKQMRKDPKAFPRNPDDEGAADAATDAIRYVCDDSDWDEVRSDAFDNLVVEGTGIVFVGHKETKHGIDPALTHIPWDRYFHDPHSSRADFSDKGYDGIVTWYDEAVAKEKWPEAERVIGETLESDQHQETYDDRPKNKLWTDYRRKRIRVVECYYLERGRWMRAVYTRLGFLEEPAPSPYIDENGQPENPLKAISLYVDRDNNRYGNVRTMIDPQDEVNKRRSKGLHLITMRQFRMSPNAMEDKETIKRELADPQGGITAENGDFEILNTNDMAAANFQLQQQAVDFINGLGPNAALAGKNENDMSGRAILAQQQGGMVEQARLFDRLRQLSIEVYRSVWNRIRQFWPHERWVRVTDNENRLRFVGLNQQVTLAQLSREVMAGDEAATDKARQLFGPVVDAALQGDQQAITALGIQVQMSGDQVVEVRNAVNELDVDIVIDEGMDTPTLQAEQFDTLAKMLGSAPEDYQRVLWEALFDNSALRNKDSIKEKIEEAQQADPMQAQLAQIMQQLQLMAAQAGVEKTQSETMRNVAMAETAAMGTNDPVEQQLRAQENAIAAFEADTNRIQAMKPDNRAA